MNKNGNNCKKIILHCCCAPCSVNVAPELSGEYDVTCFFYNPNIDDPDEYKLRLEEMKRLSEINGIPLVIGDYDVERWREITKGLENEPEGRGRCEKCFEMRLDKTALAAKQAGIDFFATTLTVAPMKNAEKINKEGEKAASNHGVSYMPSNFKKKDGYKKSVEKSREYGLYRQDYCGCSFSKRARQNRLKPSSL